MFVKNYALTENGTQSVLAADYDVKDNQVAASIATENLSKPYIAEAVKSEQKNLVDALEAQGITPAKIAQKIDYLLESEDESVIDKGLSHAIKIGVGGGYAAEKHLVGNVNLDSIQKKQARIYQEIEEEQLTS